MRRAFYVSIRKGDKAVFALGPFRTHGRALGLVDMVRKTVARSGLDPWADYGYGTASTQLRHDIPAGCMNQVFNVGPDVGVRLAPAQSIAAGALTRLEAACS